MFNKLYFVTAYQKAYHYSEHAPSSFGLISYEYFLEEVL